MPTDDDSQRKAEDSGVREDLGSRSGDAGQAPPRRVRKPLPPLITSLGGSAGYWRPKATEVPPTLPASLPHYLVAYTDVVICEAVREFADQTHCAELCRRVISKLAPRFSAAVGSGLLRADTVRPIVSDLLHTLVVYNSEYDLDGYRLEQEFWRSDEWQRLATEVAQASEATATSRLKMRAHGVEAEEMRTDDEILADISYQAEPMIRQLDRDLREKYEKLQDQGHPGPPSLSPAPAYAKPMWVAKLRVEFAKERLTGLFRICGEALTATRRPRTPSILRAILARFLVPAIKNHVEDLKDILNLAVFRSHYISDEALARCQLTLEEYVREVSDLVGVWTDIVECEARKLEFATEETRLPRTVNASGEGEARHVDVAIAADQPQADSSPSVSREDANGRPKEEAVQTEGKAPGSSLTELPAASLQDASLAPRGEDQVSLAELPAEARLEPGLHDTLSQEIADLKSEGHTASLSVELQTAMTPDGPLGEPPERQEEENDQSLAPLDRQTSQIREHRGQAPVRREPNLLNSDPEIVRRLAIVHQNPRLSSKQLCKRFDLAGIGLPSDWEEKYGVSDWRTAYLHLRCRRLIHKLVSTDRQRVKVA